MHKLEQKIAKQPSLKVRTVYLYASEKKTYYAGCLQSAYSLHTFRIESIAHGKPAPVDELQFHGVHNPDFLRKVIAVCCCLQWTL